MFGTKKSQTQPEPVETIAAQEHKQSIGNQVMEALGVGENGTGLDEESEILMPKQNQRQLEAEGVVKESVCVISKDRLLSIGAGESDFSNVLLDSNEISNCVPEPVDSDDDVEAIQANADKKALGASVTSITVAPDDTIEGYPDAYTYRLDGNDGVKMNVKLKVSTTNGDAHMKATIGMRIINGAWKIVSIDSKRDIFTGLSVLDPEW